ncbi:hypothetical protein Tfer_0900 [Thermincola ferriacetica]|uniref:Uncharacterized protein n=1 Tax=Thermincola ferriacetica TaxID=281456 RepID=A0A0L6W481_9FIRM|nr:hypothetical protein [Thermincola ferriacetica]KNZ70340.1 hypothetical protein Tfer_0900 [Thermincola ferriacetica]
MIDAGRLNEILSMHKAMSGDQVKRLFWTAGSRRADRALKKIAEEADRLIVARDYTPHGFPAVMYMPRNFCINPPMAKKLVMANELWFRYWERYGWDVKFVGFLYRDVTAWIRDLNGVIHQVIAVLTGERLPRIPVEAERVVYITEGPLPEGVRDTERVKYLTLDRVQNGTIDWI